MSKPTSALTAEPALDESACSVVTVSSTLGRLSRQGRPQFAVEDGVGSRWMISSHWALASWDARHYCVHAVGVVVSEPQRSSHPRHGDLLGGVDVAGGSRRAASTAAPRIRGWACSRFVGNHFVGFGRFDKSKDV
ncbi:uncharacterized protein A4U43_C03F1110 [Asparagus officinalis]|uniref:Uncharacterized protein n=1 Tax=Asparagus officinalis TaxID=4686 RepID=A0A5P1F6C2_ASPOF|nr:uncharacterized protein A4U43_C03F1110 [Asparagus officinalis]